jgi:hypothetical protein
MNRAVDFGAAVTTMAELDQLECTCWSKLIARAHTLAGEL